MALHFTEEEFARRKASVLAKMADRKLDALLIFAQESMFWLTGYDTFGFNLFQCLVLKKDGSTNLLTRAIDKRQAELTSNIGEIHIWSDRIKKSSPAVQLCRLLDTLDLLGARLGVEYDTHGLTASDGRALDQSLAGFADCEDASDIIPPLRAIKSGAEIAFVRQAAKLTDQALTDTLPIIAPGASEADILANMQHAILANGGDFAANDFSLNSGDHALLSRSTSGRRNLDTQDQLTIAWSGTIRHYHAPALRTIAIGTATKRHKELFDIASQTLKSVEECLQPGHNFGDVFDRHAKVIDELGANPHRMNACGYSVGARFAPSWMDWPLIYRGNNVEICPNMTLTIEIMLMDSEQQTAMCLGQTYLTTEGTPESLSQLPIELLVK